MRVEDGVVLRGRKPPPLPRDPALEKHSPVLYKYLDQSDRLVIVKTQDVEPILDAVKSIPDIVDKRKVAKSGMRFLASIPNVIALQWADESGTSLYSKEWREVVKKKLQDPEFAKLKVKY